MKGENIQSLCLFGPVNDDNDDGKKNEKEIVKK